MRVYASAGEHVTCEACGSSLGHFCCDVAVGGLVSSAQFVLPTGEHPTPGTGPENCKCGARGFRESPLGGMQAHFADGWRSMVSP